MVAMERRQLVTSRGRRKGKRLPSIPIPNYQPKHRSPITFTPHFITNVYRLNNGDNEKNRRMIVLTNRTASLTYYKIPAACAVKAIRITQT